MYLTEQFKGLGVNQVCLNTAFEEKAAISTLAMKAASIEGITPLSTPSCTV